MTWGSDEEVERRNRIRLAVWAYAYELANDSLVDDAVYDKLSLAIRPELSTGHPVLDKFFRTEFDPSTGMWVRRHPELLKLQALYRRLKDQFDPAPRLAALWAKFPELKDPLCDNS